MIDLNLYLLLSAVLFSIGVLGVLIRRNAIIIFMSIELMLNAINLSLVAFSSFLGNVNGQIFVFIVLTVAAAEAAIGLAIIISLFRNKDSVNIDEINILKW
ncbi:NADH-quinone oxidoreductase subunit NuoK [soil metagenome]